MAVARWTANFCDYTGSPIGAIPGDDRKFTFRLNQPNTAEMKVPMQHTIARQIAATPYGFGYIKVYRDGVLMMVAETTSIQVQSTRTERSLAIVATETFYPRAEGFILNPGNVYTMPGTFNLNQSMVDLVEFSEPFTGIGGGTATAGGVVAESNFDIGTSLLTLVQGLAFRASGFDFWITPQEITAGDMPEGPSGLFNAAPFRGSTKSNVSFEFGVGRNNVEEYSLTALGGEHLCNRAYVTGTDAGSVAPETAVDGTSQARLGYRARYLTSDFDNAPLRQAMADMHVSKRAYPRIVYTMKPQPSQGDGRVPQPFVDYDVGDIFRARVLDTETTLLDAEVRAYGVIVSPDKDGTENVELELSPDTSA